MNRQKWTLEDWDRFMTRRQYHRIKASTVPLWDTNMNPDGSYRQFGYYFGQLNLTFSFSDNRPQLTFSYHDPRDTDHPDEHTIRGTLRLPAAQGAFVAEFDRLEAAFIKGAVNMIAMVYGNVNVPV